MAACKLTRLVLWQEIYNFQRKNHMTVGVAWGPDFREATIRTLEIQFAVRRSYLTGEVAKIFDNEVYNFYVNLPRWWQECSQNKKHFLRHHQTWADHEITLQPHSPSIVPVIPAEIGAENMAENMAEIPADFVVVNNFSNVFSSIYYFRIKAKSTEFKRGSNISEIVLFSYSRCRKNAKTDQKIALTS